MGRYRRGDLVWSIERPAPDRIVTIDPDGTQRDEQLASPQLAQARFTVLVNQRTRDGFRLVKDEPVVASPKPPVVFDARNPELEAAIAGDPDSIELRLIYGDWLLAQGDPRGEHIARSAAALADQRLRSRVDQLLDVPELQRYFFRDLRDRRGLRVLVKWGFIDAIIVNQAFVPETDLLRPTLALDELRLLSELQYHGAPASLLEPPIPVIAELAPRSLRRLELHGIADPNLEPLLPRFARLTQLTLDVTLPPGQLDLITRQPMPHVRSLALRVGEADLFPQLVQWLETMPALEDLHFLHHHDASWLARLAESPLAQRLVTLGVPAISSADARVIGEVRHAFPKLRRLRGVAAMDLSNDAKYELGDLLNAW